ncbi:hypothetical protein FPV67DRAFT_170959 [Lyophyllum atratum]|nr:hypothetical protein FPV67DRAFT_170959 [Lyophyllum atratum]
MRLPFTKPSPPDVDPVDNSDSSSSSRSNTHSPISEQSSTTPADKADIASLVAKYGSSSATAWLEFDRYKIWRPSKPIPESSFLPVQGYMRHDPYVFAWGNPLVSDSAALQPTAQAFQSWADVRKLHVVWACVDQEFEHVLAGPPFNWSVIECIYEETLDPAHVIELTGPEAVGQQNGASVVKDLKKNLRRAEKEDVHVAEVKANDWSDENKRDVERGITAWKNSRPGIQIASTSLEPWIDIEHRRYWVARKDGKTVGLLILTPIHGHNWQIKNAISFPDAPRGTSEALIYTALSDLYHETHPDAPQQDEVDRPRVTLSFGITASDEMKPVENLAGWKVTLLSSIYGQVTRATGLLKRGNFRRKFDSERQPMYVCYPQDGFGLDGVNTMLKLLRK